LYFESANSREAVIGRITAGTGCPIQQRVGMEVSSNHTILCSEQRVDGDMLRSMEKLDVEVLSDGDGCDKSTREKHDS
jgi:hypothetical protein